MRSACVKCVCGQGTRCRPITHTSWVPHHRNSDKYEKISRRMFPNQTCLRWCRKTSNVLVSFGAQRALAHFLRPCRRAFFSYATGGKLVTRETAAEAYGRPSQQTLRNIDVRICPLVRCLQDVGREVVSGGTSA